MRIYYFNIKKFQNCFRHKGFFLIFTVQHLRSQPDEVPGLSEVIVIVPLFLKGPEKIGIIKIY